MAITSKTHQTVVLPKSLTRDLKKLAKADGRSMTKLVELVMRKYAMDRLQGKLNFEGGTK